MDINDILSNASFLWSPGVFAIVAALAVLFVWISARTVQRQTRSGWKAKPLPAKPGHYRRDRIFTFILVSRNRAIYAKIAESY